jgi:hypothetical protein
MKKGDKIEGVPDEQAVTFLEETLIAEGYALPREPEEISTDDLAAYGKGQPLELDVLRRSFESLARRGSAPKDVALDVGESLARAARNGTRISDAIWKRMEKDRDEAEAEAHHRE